MSSHIDASVADGEDAEWIARQIGPQQVGGRYYNGSRSQEYEVLRIDDQPDSWGPWEISVRWADGREDTHCTAWDDERDRVIAQPPAPDVTIVSTGRLHDAKGSQYAGILARATIAVDLRFHFRDPHISADLRELTAHDQAVRDTVMNTPGVRELLAATALQILAYLAGPSKAPVTVVTQCAGGRHRAAVTAMALHAVVAGDVEEAAAYGLTDAAKAFTERGLIVQLAHRDIGRDVVHR
ncbi:RNase adapter RapZ [Streptomyces scabiei]|uniref:RapZ C-terminal domain-containing protein n=1 Tax=Streptomyces scabiei TaxID=1930 RepID=UPI00298F0A47|nr:RNase adapter RapZ [Streptomyces scabiei]MDW8478366.1 RNase adapter RapZ [Streptomyces scabiei]